ncbi:MAG TPA: hypothetical protein VLB44_01180 [Kofleriaceae bacterium]|nr:hypothetical protein [Kofleriaceae bacterium]
MARGKNKAPDVPDAPNPKVPAIIQPKTRMQWAALLRDTAAKKWRTIQVHLKVRDKLLAGKPKHLDAAKAMLAARGLEDQIEAIPEDPAQRAAIASAVSEEGINEFHRRPGKEGIWLPTNNLKAGLKENWSVLGYRKEYIGSRVSLAEAMFVYSIQPPDAPSIERDYLYLGEKADGIETSVCHSDIQGVRMASIKRNEYLVSPTISFEMRIASEITHKLPDEALAAVILHMAEHGIGASRSQGHGKFDILGIEDINVAA